MNNVRVVLSRLAFLINILCACCLRRSPLVLSLLTVGDIIGVDSELVQRWARAWPS